MRRGEGMEDGANGASGTPPPTDGFKKCGGAGDREGRPYGVACRGGRLCPPGAIQGVRCAEKVIPAGEHGLRSQCVHWLRNDRVFAWGAVDFLVVRRGGTLPLSHG